MMWLSYQLLREQESQGLEPVKPNLCANNTIQNVNNFLFILTSTQPAYFKTRFLVDSYAVRIFRILVAAILQRLSYLQIVSTTHAACCYGVVHEWALRTAENKPL